MRYKKAHFIGICGVGMSATAKLLRDSGVVISGSDEDVYPPASDFLKQENLPCLTPYAAANIPADADVIVIGKNAKLMPESNAEVAAALQSGKTILSYPEVLAELSADKENLVVAGSYGKSTMTALLAHCLEHAGLDPSFFIGAVPLSPTTSARMGKNSLFVIEGDEYPSSNTDSRSKFLHYHPAHLLITPLAHDHVNVFPTPPDYLKPFYELTALLPKDGALVVCSEGPLSGEFLQKVGRPVVTYGVSQGDYTAKDIVYGERTTLSVMHGGQKLVGVETNQLGTHNVQNIVGAAAFLLGRKLLTPEQFAQAIASFKGVRRRLDRLSEKSSVSMFEGFGSSFEKARSAIDAVRLHFPARRLVVIFEPHAFSWRNKASLPWYDSAFKGAETVFIYEPAAQGADTHEQLSQEEILARVRAAGVDARAAHENSATDIAAAIEHNDVVLFLSSGDLGGLIRAVPHLIEEEFPA